MTFDLVLSVSKTVYPDGQVEYHNGMLKMERSTKGYNEWFASLHRIDPIQNTVKAGGLCKDWFADRVIRELGL